MISATALTVGKAVVALTRPSSAARTAWALALGAGPLSGVRHPAPIRPSLDWRAYVWAGGAALSSHQRSSSEQRRPRSGTGPWHPVFKLMKSLPMGSPSQDRDAGSNPAGATIH